MAAGCCGLTLAPRRNRQTPNSPSSHHSTLCSSSNRCDHGNCFELFGARSYHRPGEAGTFEYFGGVRIVGTRVYHVIAPRRIRIFLCSRVPPSWAYPERGDAPRRAGP